MDRYQRVEKPSPEEPAKENEIRITTRGLIRNYVYYAAALLQDKGAREIVLKATGQAISKTVTIAEIIKKRVPGLHQDASISSMKITDVWEPLEEGLETVELHRHVSLIAITLSTTELNKNSPGYQAPSIARQPNAAYSGCGGGRGRGYGYRGPGYERGGRTSGGRGYGRGRGRSSRGSYY